MKTGTLDKMKFMVLKKLLGLPKYHVIGLLEGLWYLTATNAPDGAIGKFSDIEIAAWLEWEGEPEILVEAFIKAGFLDRCSEHRLVIHDWEDHAPQHVKGNIAKHNKSFAKAKNEEAPSDIPIGISQGGSLGNLLDTVLETPSKPNLTKPIKTLAQKSLRGEAFEKFWKAYPKKKSKGDAEKAFAKINPNEQLLATMIATIERAKTSDDWRKDDGQYIPFPATWLRDRRWEDEFDLGQNSNVVQYGREAI